MIKGNANIYSVTVLIVFSFTLNTFQASGEDIADSLRHSEWKGFQRIDFVFKGKKAHLVKPDKALPGNPWLWRARFPDYHAEIDSALLSKGFHVAHINTKDMFGNPDAVAIWNEFYAHLTSTCQLKNKVAFHCHSRGGLFSYNWAKKNPEKVACIYADAIVCDFKSWPGGFGISDGSLRDWEKLKSMYAFASDEDAKAYDDNPIDKLEDLAKAKVPVYHTISLNDSVVPPDENSLLLVNNYIRLGGTATVSPCSSGMQKSKGHHYMIDQPSEVIKFIMRHSINEQLSEK